MAPERKAGVATSTGTRVGRREPDRWVTIRVPLGDIPPGTGYTRSIAAASLSPRHCRAYAMLYYGAFGELLESGRPVVSPADSIRYLLEQIATEIP